MAAGTLATTVPYGWWDLGPAGLPAAHSAPVVLFSAIWYPSDPSSFMFWMFDTTTGTYAICDTSPYDYWEGEPDGVQDLRIVNDPTLLSTPEPLESGALIGFDEVCSHAVDTREGAIETWQISSPGLCREDTCQAVGDGLVGEFAIFTQEI